MYSKLMIDVMEDGTPIVSVIHPKGKLEDVRDKLVKRFLEVGPFCAITYSDTHPRETRANIISMNPLDVMQNILDWLGPMINWA